MPIYPDRSAGLKRLIQDILKASKSGDLRALSNYLNSLVIFRQDDADASKRVQVGGTVQRARLIYQEPPEYPSQASRAGLHGLVRLSALIGRDGRVQSIQVLQGHCWLVEAAVKAVRQWRYSPLLLNGEPVEVVTMIEVNFAPRS